MHCTHDTSLPVSSSTVCCTPGVPRLTVTTYWNVPMEYPMVAGTVADLEEPAASCARVPAPDDTLLWTYSARRWSARSTSANDGPACTDDLGDGARE